MLISMLPLVSVAACMPAEAGEPGDDVVIATPRAAQVRLADLIVEADAIHAVTPAPHGVAFTIDRADRALRVTAHLGRRGLVTSLAIDHAGPPIGAVGDTGAFGWLHDELADTIAITRLLVGETGTVTAITSDARRYQLLPARAIRTNAAVEARWAAAWES